MAEKLRDWQVDCLQAISTSMIEGARDFLAVATPGAGKTTMALTFAKRMKIAGRFNFGIVVCPSKHLKFQWMMAAAKMGLKFRSNLDNESLGYGIPDDIDGYCVTYAQVAFDPDLHALACGRKCVLVILDEVHHGAEELSWGEGLIKSFQNAQFRLLLSGTPFRSDNNPIPFVTYRDGVSVEDYAYRYGRAVSDRVCRPVVFPHFEGKMDWMDGFDFCSASFTDELDRRGESRRLMTALNPKGSFVVNMLRAANDKLKQVRLGSEADPKHQHSNAGGLVVAMSRDHANDIAAVMRKEFGVDPIVVHYDDKDANDKIRAFSESSDPWIVAINMISEGVDIPRLRVGVYATNKMTAMFFQQVIGRVIRMTAEPDQQTAYFYIPKDQRLMDMAISIRNEIHHALMEPELTDKKETPSDRQPLFFTIIDSDGEEDGHIAGEDIIPSEEIEHARMMQREIPELCAISEASIALLCRRVSGFSTRVVNVTDVPVNDPANEIANPDVENKRLRGKADDLVVAIAYGTNPDASSKDFSRLHREINLRVGIVKTPVATNAQLIEKINLLQNMKAQQEERGDTPCQTRSYSTSWSSN